MYSYPWTIEGARLSLCEQFVYRFNSRIKVHLYTSPWVPAELGRLESKEKAVLEARYIEELSANVIARQMNTTEKAVYSLLYRAKKSLRRELELLAAANKKEENDDEMTLYCNLM